jgi:outer membrane protein OmpA-like peptidoglycan-associated protein
MWYDVGRRTRWLFILLICLLLVSQAFAAGESELQVKARKPGAIVTVEREINYGMVQLSVSDAANKPIFGLTKDDFVVTAAGRTARIISAQPIEKSLDVPRNIVVVLDNSDSMSHRNAVRPLLAGVDELLKIVRPIDQVQIVVFSGKEKMTMGGRDLRVRTFKSNKPDELKRFIAEVYRDGMTSTTVLNEGMLAGIEIIRTMPANEPRFLVVFSDGEDLNSAYNENEVTGAAEGAGRFNAYAIDYMPGPATDEFLMTFTERNRGQIWKAKSETSLVPIFRSVASKMLYYYVVSYLFPTTGSLAVVPASLTINELAVLDPSSQPERSAGVAPAKRASVISRIDTSALTLRPVVDTAYNFASWKVIVANSRGTLAEKDGEGTPPAEIVVPLKTDDLGILAAGGDIKVSMEVQDSKGQSIVLRAPSVKVNYFKTTGSLAVVPASLTINELTVLDPSSQPERSAGVAPAKRASVTSRIDTSALTLRPVVDTAYNFAHWKVIVANSSGTLAEKDGEGTPPAEIVVPLKTDDLGILAAGGDIKVSMEVQDSKGQSIVLRAPSVKVNYFKTTGSLAVAPASLTIEEIKTIDSSPMLGYIYFLKGSSNLSAQYVRLAGSEETAAYDEQRFRDTLEKYYQVLNIIGKRLTGHPAATITLTGCNDNTGTEKRNRKLSTARAESVRDYLQAAWNIAPDRIRTDARNLPEIPSTSRLEQGRAENRRVEIRADDLSILAPVRSTYLSVRIDAEALTLRPAVNAPHGFAHWTIRAANNSGSLGELSGEGAPPAEIIVPLKNRNLNEVAVGGDITLTMEVKDRKDQKLELAAGPVKVNFIQTSQRLAQKQDFRVQEKYALILFDFDSNAISARNQEIVNAIVKRIRELSQAPAEIVGHTDNIGKKDYNIKLSQRRALSVYKLLSAAYREAPSDHIRYSGVGPKDPLFDNMTPEARALNRTVTITLEYMAVN